MPRSLKPRRLYYSPIGDGVVAADGVELKREPKDLSPKITVTHMKTLDRGEPGHDGYNIYTRTTTQGICNWYIYYFSLSLQHLCLLLSFQPILISNDYESILSWN